jgi:sugar porter (SP) family MFS transporter
VPLIFSLPQTVPQTPKGQHIAMPEPRVDTEAVQHQDFTPAGARRGSSASSSTVGGRNVVDSKAADDSSAVQHAERRRSSASMGFKGRQPSVAAQLTNPLAGMGEADVLRDVDTWVRERGLEHELDTFRRGALLARVINTQGAFEQLDLPEDERDVLRREHTNRWSQPFMLYFVVVLCAGSAIVQGMDQTAVNGAQTFYLAEFNITNTWQVGLLNGAPYLCSALIGCWTNAPLNHFFGRRGTIFISCFISFAASFWMAACEQWWNLLLARFALGFAVGAKSSTTPVYAAESAPKSIRGALTMQWQMWTAFGIMLGFAVSVAFENVRPITGDENEPWRWMMASTAIPPMIVMAQVYLCPESPRWYMSKGKFDKAFNAFCRLRNHKVLAARDMYYANKLLEVEEEQRAGKNLFKEFFTLRRNRRAAQSAFFVMFMQQFCGVNVIAYYSTSIFVESGFTRSRALLVSLGTGAVNWLFAIPAIYTIDTFGRRNLLLVGFPVMAICLLITGFSFWIDVGVPESEGRLAGVATGIFLFMAAYSPSEGPVPFTYSAEAFPIYIRDVGMSFATATCWGFNFILSLTWPSLLEAFGPQGAFGYYAAWNCFGAVFAYFLLPETKVCNPLPIPRPSTLTSPHRISRSKSSTPSSTSATVSMANITWTSCPGTSTRRSCVATSRPLPRSTSSASTSSAPLPCPSLATPRARRVRSPLPKRLHNALKYVGDIRCNGWTTEALSRSDSIYSASTRGS